MKPFSLIIMLSIYLLCPFIVFGHHESNKELDSLMHILDSRSERDSIQANLMHEVAYLSYTNNLELTKKLAEELAILAEEINYPKGIIQSFNLMGIYYDNIGEYEKSFEAHQKSLDLARQYSNKKGISSAYNNLGIISEILGEYPQALDYYHKSIKIDDELQDSLGKAKTLLQLGSLYEYMSDTIKALNHYEQSLELALKINDEKIISYNLMNIGYITHAQGDNKKARPFFFQSLEISEKNNQQEGILLSLMMIGILDIEEGHFEKAVKNIEKSLEISRSTGNNTYERYALFHLADAYFRMNDLKQAYSLAKQAYNPNDYCDESLQMTTTELLSDITAIQGKYKEAYEYHKEFKKLQDHSFNDENRRKISQLEYENKLEKERQALELEQQKKEALYQAEQEREVLFRNFILVLLGFAIILLITIFNNARNRRKTNENLTRQKQQLLAANELLNNQKKELEKTTAALQKANQTKDTFFSIIAHDLRAPFNTILGFSNILLEEDEEFDKESRETFIGKIKKGSETALILLENLFNWARSNSGDFSFNPKVFQLANTIKKVCKLYENGAHAKHIKLDCTISKEADIYADEEMLRTIVRNLISNALKFTPTHGEINIFSTSDEKNTKVHVKDSGMGMNQDQIKNLFELNKKTTRNGTSGEKGTGLGLILCYEFTQKHKGKIEVISEISKGTEVIVSFPRY